MLGIAGTVGVFVAMLALARGFKATMTSSGLADNAIVQQAGADSEMTSIMTMDDVRVIEDAPQVARDGNVPLVSPEVVVMAALPLRQTGTDANVSVRGVEPRALQVHRQVRLVEGRFLTPGIAEAIVGRGAQKAYAGLDLGATVKIGAGTWTIVGVFDGPGHGLRLRGVGRRQRPRRLLQAADEHLPVGDGAAALARRAPRVQGAPRRRPAGEDHRHPRRAYYEKQSVLVTTLISVLGTLVAVVMGLGAVFGALNTMYSAVSERSREIAVLRAIGFGGGAIVLAFLVESLAIALVGGRSAASPRCR
ncbi:MAG: ABC transporter permease [Vicinamibacteria bacterium]